MRINLILCPLIKIPLKPPATLSDNAPEISPTSTKLLTPRSRHMQQRTICLLTLTALVWGGVSCHKPSGSNAIATEPSSDAAYAARRESMVNRQILGRGVTDTNVLAAMRKVPRHRFVPAGSVDRAYVDSPLRIGHDQTISQPYIVALMTELLAVDSDSKILEIGTGSGYQAAVLAEIVAEVSTIEIVEPLGIEAKKRLQEMGYKNVRVKIGDGYQGWSEHAPFDAIIVTCAPDHVPQPLVDQLKIGGRMCIPVGPTWGNQMLYLLVKQPGGELKTQRTIPVRFVPMTGEADKKPSKLKKNSPAPDTP